MKANEFLFSDSLNLFSNSSSVKWNSDKMDNGASPKIDKIIEKQSVEAQLGSIEADTR